MAKPPHSVGVALDSEKRCVKATNVATGEAKRSLPEPSKLRASTTHCPLTVPSRTAEAVASRNSGTNDY